MEFAQIVRHGNITIMAINFGRTRNESDRWPCLALDFFGDLHVRFSAANAEPDRPITTIAVISGPNSRVMEIATALRRSSSAELAHLDKRLCSAGSAR